MSDKTELAARPLTAEAFAAFGEVIDLKAPRGAPEMQINDGLTTRFHDLFTIDTAADGGRPVASIFRSQPLPLPHRVRELERHPLGSQAFIPLDDLPFLVLVAADASVAAATGAPAASVAAAQLELFISTGRQGVNLHKNTWHHFQIVLGKRRDFLVIDRGGAGANLEEARVDGEVWIPAVELPGAGAK